MLEVTTPNKTAFTTFLDTLIPDKSGKCFNCHARGDDVRFSNLFMEWTCDNCWKLYINKYSVIA